MGLGLGWQEGGGRGAVKSFWGRGRGTTASERPQGQEAPTEETPAVERPEGAADVLGAEDLRRWEAGCAR